MLKHVTPALVLTTIVGSAFAQFAPSQSPTTPQPPTPMTSPQPTAAREFLAGSGNVGAEPMSLRYLSALRGLTSAGTTQPEQPGSSWMALLPDGSGHLSLGLSGNTVAILLNGQPFPADCIRSEGDAIVYEWPKGTPVAALKLAGGTVTPVAYRRFSGAGGDAPRAAAAPATDRLILGVSIGELSEEVGAHLQINPAEVVYVSGVTSGYGAEAAGIRPRDIIVSIDGQKPVSQESLREVLASKSAGDTVDLEVFRAGATRNVTVTLQNWRDESVTTADPTWRRAPSGEVPVLQEVPLLGHYLNQNQAAQADLDRARFLELTARAGELRAAQGTTEATEATAARVAELMAQAQSMQEQIARRQNDVAVTEAHRDALSQQLALLANRGTDPSDPVSVTSRLVVPRDAAVARSLDEWRRSADESYPKAMEAYQQAIQRLLSNVETATDDRARVMQSTEELARRVEEISARMERMESLLQELAGRLERR